MLLLSHFLSRWRSLMEEPRADGRRGWLQRERSCYQRFFGRRRHSVIHIIFFPVFGTSPSCRGLKIVVLRYSFSVYLTSLRPLTARTGPRALGGFHGVVSACTFYQQRRRCARKWSISCYSVCCASLAFPLSICQVWRRSISARNRKLLAWLVRDDYFWVSVSVAYIDGWVGGGCLVALLEIGMIVVYQILFLFFFLDLGSYLCIVFV